MDINITLRYIRGYAKLNPRLKEICERELYWGQEDNDTEFPISDLEPEELEQFREYLQKFYSEADEKIAKLKDKNDGKQTEERGKAEQTRGMLNVCLQKISALKQVKSNPLAPVKSLDTLKEALTEYIRTSPEKWLFKTASDNRNLPHLVTSVSYHPRDRDRPAYVEVNIQHVYLDEIKNESISFYYSDLFPDDKKITEMVEELEDSGADENTIEVAKEVRLKTVKNKKGHKYEALNCQQLLDKKGYILGVQSLIDAYEREFAIFIKYRDMTGEQFTSQSIGYSIDSYSSWRSNRMSLNTDGVPHKLVVNESADGRLIKGKDRASGAFWGNRGEEAILKTPMHMYIRMFNLRTHEKVSVHSSTLTPYEYDTKLIEKLVLPVEVKELVEILGKGAAEGLGDIVSGKAEGIIVGCVGAPGLGKTLTAEIYSEFLKRPLYSVQCAQLGIKPDELEKELMEVLGNAQRWKAVLLLDEADVYIRKRGHDIHQNAIVGVFLRVLEYYPGILFMTTNLEETIDDAIESRFTAKVVFEYPDEKAAKSIWAIQMLNHKWKPDAKIIDAMVKSRPNLSGRGIRALMKLSTLLARYRKQELTLELLEHASKFAVHEKGKKKKTEGNED